MVAISHVPVASEILKLRLAHGLAWGTASGGGERLHVTISTKECSTEWEVAALVDGKPSESLWPKWVNQTSGCNLV